MPNFFNPETNLSLIITAMSYTRLACLPQYYLPIRDRNPSFSLKLQQQSKVRRAVKMSATELTNSKISYESYAIKPPMHPTYDLKGIIKLALAEDAGDRGDVTCLATIPSDMEVEAYFLAKEDGIIAGIALAEMIFHEVDPSLKVEWSKNDGEFIHKGLQFGKVHGRAHNIIVAERVVLNFMQRMSGIATLTKAMADAAHPAYILETRKTAPGLRLLDKWAVLIGGGRNHRMGLFDMVMIKDNHISTAGGVTNAIRAVDLYLEQKNLQMEVEVETRTLEEVKEVLHHASQTKTSLTRIMLDNMVLPLPNGDVDTSMLIEAVQLVNGRFETEASGNVTLDTVHKIGQSGVTYISSGSLTHSVKALDISLKIDTELALKVGRRTGRA
ncbi:PREDICTED: nicotinate-nucleotide pyrophosphorylase [carboxylating], chloroplastic isoform X2 [Lupinus angustifolius]|uniref:nicotinate-nucleotide pyrophosphorylase [carboxylating], chloroplastic isoform X2 n=1 Tax=Lupinus angustifolius TaxID=3871 RepID=UPI00092EF8DC|nr:PREDICTED: nicotinate-nucleotide pyrophosphorylase [carboxylating], chloroplastic isoform X2 [Lupinus angustifolius]